MTDEQWERLLEKLLARTEVSTAGWEKADVEGRWILPAPSGSITVETRPGNRSLVFSTGPAIAVRSRSGGVTYRMDGNLNAIISGASPARGRAGELLRRLAQVLDAYDEELQAFVDNLIDEV